MGSQKLTLFLLVGAGGMLGSMARYGVSLLALQLIPTFPLGTLLVNILGCFLMGAVFEGSQQMLSFNPELKIFLATGFCGGFTTFSALVYESSALIKDREWWFCALYLGLSAVGGFLALSAGIQAIKLIQNG